MSLHLSESIKAKHPVLPPKCMITFKIPQHTRPRPTARSKISVTDLKNQILLHVRSLPISPASFQTSFDELIRDSLAKLLESKVRKAKPECTLEDVEPAAAQSFRQELALVQQHVLLRWSMEVNNWNRTRQLRLAKRCFLEAKYASRLIWRIYASNFVTATKHSAFDSW